MQRPRCFALGLLSALPTVRWLLFSSIVAKFYQELSVSIIACYEYYNFALPDFHNKPAISQRAEKTIAAIQRGTPLCLP